MPQGRLEAIFTAPSKAAPMTARDSVRAVPGKGLEGDRYFDNAGTFCKPERKPANEVTLIEAEAVAAVTAEGGPTLSPSETRRNLLISGVALNHLVGKEFTVGPVRLKGIKLCEPCGHLEKLTRDGVKNGLIHRGGLRAQILSEGLLSVGDGVAV